MKTQFETEDEAAQALGAARAKSLGWCPIIQKSCHVIPAADGNCICYYEGTIRHQEAKQFRNFDARKEYWFVQYPGCTNVLISGVITVES
jgi:hypothetical protein